MKQQTQENYMNDTLDKYRNQKRDREIVTYGFPFSKRLKLILKFLQDS